VNAESKLSLETRVFAEFLPPIKEGKGSGYNPSRHTEPIDGEPELQSYGAKGFVLNRHGEAVDLGWFNKRNQRSTKVTPKDD